MKSIKFKYIINKIWFFALSFQIFHIIDLLYVGLTRNDNWTIDKILIHCVPFFAINLITILIIWILSLKRTRTYLWAKNINKNSISAWHFFIYENALSKKTNKEMNQIYLNRVHKIWDKKVENTSNKFLNNKHDYDLIYIYYIHWMSWINSIINLISFIMIFHFIEKYMDVFEFKTYNNLKTFVSILYAAIFLFYTINIMVSAIIFAKQIQNLKTIINNSKILNKYAKESELRDFILLDAISYTPNVRKTFYSTFRWLDNSPSIIKKIIFLLIVPSDILDDKIFKIIKKFNKSENPKITIHNVSQSLVNKIKENKFTIINDNHSDITIVLDKQHVEYPALFKLIHNETNLKITTNDMYFEKFLKIILVEIYKTSFEKLNFKINIENQLDWQIHDHL